MPNSINVYVYKIERGTDNVNNAVTMAYNQMLTADEILSAQPVNQATGVVAQHVFGLPYLYSKVILDQPGMGQEFYTLDTVATLQGKIG